MKRFTGLIGFLVLCIGCASFTVNYDFDQEFDFFSIKTYNWLPIPEKAQINELAVKHVKFAVNNEMKAKGFQMTSENPDVLIALHGGKEKKVDVQEWGYTYGDYNYHHWGPYHPWGFDRDTVAPPLPPGPSFRDYSEYRRGTDTYEYEVGTLIIDIVDAKKKELIWRGTGTGIIDPGKTSEQINEVVKKLLENFPPVKKK